MSAARKFAEGTTVSVAKSRMEIETLVTRYGATTFGSGWDETHRTCSIMFVAKNRRVRFELALPDPKSRAFTYDGRGSMRSDKQRADAYDAELRRLWRALALVIKAKLEAVQSGVTSFDDEFLAHFVAADGRTIGETLHGALDQISSGTRLLLPQSSEIQE